MPVFGGVYVGAYLGRYAPKVCAGYVGGSVGVSSQEPRPPLWKRGRPGGPARLRLGAQPVGLGDDALEQLGGRERRGYGALHGAGRVRWRAPAARVGVERVRGARAGRVGEDARGELGLSCDVAGRAVLGRLVRARAAAVVARGRGAVAGFVLITLYAVLSSQHDPSTTRAIA